MLTQTPEQTALPHVQRDNWLSFPIEINPPSCRQTPKQMATPYGQNGRQLTNGFEIGPQALDTQQALSNPPSETPTTSI